MIHDIIRRRMSSLNGKSSRPSRRIRVAIIAIVGLAVIAYIAAPSAILLASIRAARSQGILLAVDGLSIGGYVTADRVTLRLPSQPLPFLDARHVEVGPRWGACLRGNWTIDGAAADSIAVRWDDALAEWLRHRPESRGPSAAWNVGRIRIANWSASVLGWTVSGTADLDGITPGSVDSAIVRFATLMGIEGSCVVESGWARIQARGAGVPVAVRAIPGMDQSADTWTLDARAATTTEAPAAASSSGLRGPAWFEAILDRRLHGRAEILAETGATGFIALDADPESRYIRIDGRVGTVLTIRGTSAFSGDTLRTLVSYKASQPGAAVLEGRLDLDLLPLDGMRVLAGSAFTLEEGSVRGSKLPAGRVEFSGDNARGFHLVSTGSLGQWTADLDPAKFEATWRGTIRARQAGPVRDLEIAGEAELRRRPAGLLWSAKGSLSGIADAGATPVRFRGEGDASGSGDKIGMTLRSASISPAGGSVVWNLALANLKVGGSEASWTASLGAGSAMTLYGRSIPVDLEARGGPSIVELSPLRVGGIAIRARTELSGGRYRETRITIDETPVGALAAFLPPPLKTIFDRSEVAGRWSGEFRHTADRKMDGSLRIEGARFHDPVTAFVVENFSAEIPIRQRFVDADKVQFVTDAERWPADVPVNLRIGTIGKKDVVARDLAGRAVFSDYVFRVRDIAFGLLGGRGRSRFMLDPFRNEKGRFRSALELKIDDLPLSNLYAEFVGKGSIAKTLDGDVSVDLECAWSDTESIEAKGKIFAPRSGRIGYRVIDSLVKMLEPSKRPPGIALMLVGDYRFDTLQIHLARDPEIHDFRTRLLLEGEKEPFLRTFKLELPLLNLLQGLPVDISKEIGFKHEP